MLVTVSIDMLALPIKIQSKIVAVKAKEIGLIGDNQLTYPIVVRYGANDQGKTIRYYQYRRARACD